MAFNFSPKIITDGLVLYLDAANKKSYPGSETTWNDLSKGKNNGTLVNGPTFSSANGGSLLFDGVDDYATGLGTAIISTTQITISIWNNGQVAKNSTIFFFTESGYNRVCLVHLPWSDSNIYFDCGASSTTTYDRISKLATATDYQGWHYWVFTKNSTTGNMRIYRDGILWHSASSLTASLRSCNVGRLGSDGSINYHQGNIASFMVYNRELSANEILQNFNATKGRFGL